jgi:hypothetical protein
VEVFTLIPLTPTEMKLAGDFNCIVNSMNSTGNNNCSKALQNLIRNSTYTTHGHQQTNNMVIHITDIELLPALTGYI